VRREAAQNADTERLERFVVDDVRVSAENDRVGSAFEIAASAPDTWRLGHDVEEILEFF
jgi:hypothetical protein